MTVKELIEVLQSHDPSAMVVVAGYEGGYNEVGHADDVVVALNVNDNWYFGDHELVHRLDYMPDSTDSSKYIQRAAVRIE